MRRHIKLLLTIPLLGACDWEVLGPSDEPVSLCWWGCYDPTPTLATSGLVYVGPHPTDEGEAKVLLYLPSDTETPIDSVEVWGGSYWLDFGPAPAPVVCSYLARARLWSGETTSPEPLFPTSGCQPSLNHVTGPTFRLPAYESLAEPFVIQGRVLVAGELAGPGEVELGVQLRSGQAHAESISMSEDGEWRFETIDGAYRFSLCRRVHVYARHGASGIEQHPFLELPAEPCESPRKVPDVRIGSWLAAIVRVYRDTAPGTFTRVGAGLARVSLASPADSSIVGEAYETLDDGGVHVWLPHGMSPTCDLLLRAELGGRVQFLPLQPPYDQSCHGGYYHTVEFRGT